MKKYLLLFVLILTSCTGEEKPKFLDEYNLDITIQDFLSAHPTIQLQKGDACSQKSMAERKCENYWSGPYGQNYHWGREEYNIFTEGDDKKLTFFQLVRGSTSKGFSAYINGLASRTLNEVTGGVKPQYVERYKDQAYNGYIQYGLTWQFDNFWAQAFVLCKEINGRPQNLRDCFPYGYRVAATELKDGSWKSQDHKW